MRCWIAVVALGLAGCGGQEPAQNAAVDPVVARPTPPAQMLGGVNLGKGVSAFGTEPYWTLEVVTGEIEFRDFGGDKAEPPPQPFFPVLPVLADGKAVWTTKTATGAPVVLTLTAEKCLEAGEEEDSKPLTAELRIGDRTLHGCAGQKIYNTPVTPDNAAVENATAGNTTAR